MKTPRLRIAEMLRAQKRHISFHTPGHKRAGADITELSYSDCLASPKGLLKETERDIAEILGASRSFLLTDGSTAGIFAMVGCLKESGGRSLAVPAFSHPSVFHACAAMDVAAVTIPQAVRYGIPVQPCLSAMEEALRHADGLLLTSPDYYGFHAPLAEARALCESAGKPLFADGAHGSHLHGTAEHAGNFADAWVDGAHKSLPALTQGAVVSARGEWAARLERQVRVFRTTSPSYPILASVEYAMKYPRNVRIEGAAEAFKRRYGCLANDDWTKILVPFGNRADEAQRALEARGVYPEFNDGNYLMFYLSPCTKERELKRLGKLLKGLSRGTVGEDAPAGGIPMYTAEET